MHFYIPTYKNHHHYIRMHLFIPHKAPLFILVCSYNVKTFNNLHIIRGCMLLKNDCVK